MSAKWSTPKSTTAGVSRVVWSEPISDATQPIQAEQHVRQHPSSEMFRESAEQGGSGEGLGGTWIHVIQAAVVLAFLAIWQYGPEVKIVAEHVKFLNRFTLSAPSQVAREIWYLFIGAHNVPLVWPYLLHTVLAALYGLAIGLVLGVTVGIAFAEVPVVARIFSPMLNLINSSPRIALIPIVILIVGPTLASSVVSSVLIVFFLGFFNAFEGASAVPRAIVENARMLHASRWNMVWRIRMPNALSWVFAALPNAIAFSLVTVVTTELLTGVEGMGKLILEATSGLDAALSLAVVVLLSVVGSIMVYSGTLARHYALRWERR